MRTLILIITIAVGAVAVAQIQDKGGSDALEKRYAELMGRADSAIARADWPTAETALHSAMRLDPASPANILLLSNIGMVQFYGGKDSLALETLTDACNIAPRVLAVHANRATVLEAMGRHDEAVGEAGIMLTIDKANARARMIKFNDMMRRGDVSGATAQVDTMRQLCADNPSTWLAEGTLYSLTGRYAEALSPLTKAIERSPQPEYYAARAYCRLMTDNLNEASADIAEGLRLNPLEGELYLYRAMLNKMRYRNEEAAEDARRAMRLGIDPARAARFLK